MDAFPCLRSELSTTDRRPYSDPTVLGLRIDRNTNSVAGPVRNSKIITFPDTNSYDLVPIDGPGYLEVSPVR